MYAKIIGLGPAVQGVSQKSGKPYNGRKLYLAYDRAGVEGQAVKEQFVSFLDMDRPPIFKIGSDVFLDYDDQGFLLSFEMITPEK